MWETVKFHNASLIRILGQVVGPILYKQLGQQLPWSLVCVGYAPGHGQPPPAPEVSPSQEALEQEGNLQAAELREQRTHLAWAVFLEVSSTTRGDADLRGEGTCPGITHRWPG